LQSVGYASATIATCKAGSIAANSTHAAATATGAIVPAIVPSATCKTETGNRYSTLN
jgi:hypothetical protein